MAKKKTVIQKTGKRKRAIARAVLKPGTGEIIINNRPLNSIQPEKLKLLMEEPLIVAEADFKNIDITVNVKGGGVFGQASAVRQAIARALVENNKTLKEKFLSYDRTLLVADARRTEMHKPSRSSAGPRRHKQRSKR
ncbi:MAG: 30S ribosomal protein S9 [Candidatus Woesearchaeota archaeon]